MKELSSKLRKRFNYIVCGAGSSVCVVAARLAADLKTQVLLLEAGGTATYQAYCVTSGQFRNSARIA